jgi:hypothetical protein
MSRSAKWKQEWAFFLDTDGRRKYSEVCRRCIHDCKQSFRAVILACPALYLKAVGGSDITVRIKVENDGF